MKNVSNLLFTFICLCLPSLLTAQERDDSRYLAGAVPEIDGKVVFTKEFSIPGMDKEEVYNRVYHWMDARLKENKNNSRIVFSDLAEGQIVGTGDDWIVFSSSALALDRTRITYQLLAECQAEKCVLKVEKIRFIYREGKEKYTAEEWIVDKYALNKTQTKLVRGLAKWRRKTVDFVDDLAKGLTEVLSATTLQVVKEDAKAEEKEQPTNNGPIVIKKKNEVKEVAPAAVTPVVTPTVSAPETQKVPAVKEAPTVQEAPVTTTTSVTKEIAPANLSTDLIQTGSGKLVIVIGQEPFNMTMMTANAGGSLGKVNGKPVVFTILSPDQAYDQMEKAANYIVRFYPNGENEPSVTLECKKMPSPTAMEGMPRTYVGEILKATVK